MDNRIFQRLDKKLGYLLDPLAIVAIIGIFVISVLATMNLSISYMPQHSSNVLGVQDSRGIILQAVGGEHAKITGESILSFDNGIYKYYASFDSSLAGTFSKPILIIENNDSELAKITVLPSPVHYGTQVSIIANDIKYVISKDDGENFFETISVEPNSKLIVYLSLEETHNTSFSQEFEMTLKGSSKL